MSLALLVEDVEKVQWVGSIVGNQFHMLLMKLSEPEKAGRVTSTNCKTVQHHMEGFRQQQMQLDEITQPG